MCANYIPDTSITIFAKNHTKNNLILEIGYVEHYMFVLDFVKRFLYKAIFLISRAKNAILTLKNTEIIFGSNSCHMHKTYLEF